LSTTILRELLLVRRALTSHIVVQYGGTVIDEAIEQASYYRGVYGIKGVLSPMKCLVAEMPERRYHEQMEREEAEFKAAGNKRVCPDCGERKAREDVACTLGYPGHPGAEFTAILICEAYDCGKVTM
jgi:hypothetical protein